MRLLCVECSRHVPVFATHCPYCYPSATPRVSEPPTTKKSDESRAGSGSSLQAKIADLTAIHRFQLTALFYETQRAARLEALEWARARFGEGHWFDRMRTEIDRLKGEK